MSNNTNGVKRSIQVGSLTNSADFRPLEVSNAATGYLSTIGGTTDGFCSTSTCASFYPSVRHELESAEFVDGKIEIVKRVLSNISTYPPSPETVIKEIYGVQGNEIVLERTITGKVVPEQIIEESFEFDENA